MTDIEYAFDRIVSENTERLFGKLDDLHYKEGVSNEDLFKMLRDQTGDLDDQYRDWIEEGEG